MTTYLSETRDGSGVMPNGRFSRPFPTADAIAESLAIMKRDRAVLAWLLKQCKDRRLDGHASRRRTVEGLGLPIPSQREVPKFVGLYDDRGDLRTDYETALLFSAPGIFIDYVWGR